MNRGWDRAANRAAEQQKLDECVVGDQTFRSPAESFRPLQHAPRHVTRQRVLSCVDAGISQPSSAVSVSKLVCK